LKLSNEKRQAIEQAQDCGFVAQQELLKSLEILRDAGIKGLTKKFSVLVTSLGKLLPKDESTN
jgi:hypothetical protein